MLFAICRSSKEECEIFISIALKWLYLLSEIVSNFIQEEVYRNVQIRYIHICVVQGNSNKLFMLLFQGRTLLCVFFLRNIQRTQYYFFSQQKFFLLMFTKHKIDDFNN